MAFKTLPAFSIPQPELMQSTIAPLMAMVDRVTFEHNFPICSFESAESRPYMGDAIPCCDAGTVVHLARRQAFCARHFRKISLDEALQSLERK